MQVSVKQLFAHSLTHRRILDLIWLRERRRNNLYDLEDNNIARWAAMKHESAFEPPHNLIRLERTYPNHLAFTEPYFTWMTRTRGPTTPYAFVHKLYPGASRLSWPDFWYMQNERRETLTHLREAYSTTRLNGFRRSALFTSAEQAKEHVKLLHQGKRNTYR